LKNSLRTALVASAAVAMFASTAWLQAQQAPAAGQIQQEGSIAPQAAGQGGRRGRNAGPAEPTPKLALTFDDLPVHGALPPGLTRADVARGILAALSAKKAPPTYGFINAKGLEGGYPEVARIIHGHPTLSEAVMEAARAADGWLIHG